MSAPLTQTVYSIRNINDLPDSEKRQVYARLIPIELLQRLDISSDLKDNHGRDLLQLNCPRGSSTAEMSLYHQYDYPDPVLYGQITDTLHNRVHVLLYSLNDPSSPRFDIDRLPDGRETRFGVQYRNLHAEQDALHAGLAPGQTRHGLRLLGQAIQAFEHFVASLGQEMYFAEPLFYHNAILFERYGFTYERGRRLMQRIQEGFSDGGDLLLSLNNSTPFRNSKAAQSIRLRSWAIHDGLLGEPFNNVTMYKWVGKVAGVSTADCDW